MPRANQRDDHRGARPGRYADDNFEVTHNSMMLEEAPPEGLTLGG